MQFAADRLEATTAIRTDLGAIFISLELSRSSWVVTSLSPGGGEKMSKHTVRGGDVAGLLKRFAQLREKAKGRTGKVFPARCSPTSAGNRAFARWCGCRRLKMKTDAGFAVSARC